MLVGLVLVSLFIWFAENLSTFAAAWVYPNQRDGWRLVLPVTASQVVARPPAVRLDVRARHGARRDGVHGAAADSLVSRGIGPIGLTASEVAIEARQLINQFNQT